MLRLHLLVVGCCLLAAVRTHAADLPTEADTDRLIRELDADNFTIRAEATKQLSEQGIAALPQLELVVRTGSLEAISRALGILVGHAKTGLGDRRSEAKAALDRLALDVLPAKKAKAELEKPVVPAITYAANGIMLDDPFLQARFAQGGGRIVMGGGIRIAANFPPVPNGVVIKSVTRSFQNGITEITVLENDRSVKLTEQADKTIAGEITEKQEGQNKTEKFSVKNAAELKEKFPVAHAVYEAEFVKAAPQAKQDFAQAKQAQINTLKQHLERVGNQANIPEELRVKLTAGVQDSIKRLEDDLKKLEAAKP